MQSKFLTDKYDARINAFLDTILYYKKRLDVVAQSIEKGEEFLSIVGRRKRPMLKKYLDFLSEKEIEYQREFELAKNGIAYITKEKERDIDTLKKYAKSKKISLSEAISQIDNCYGKLDSVQFDSTDFIPPADLPLDDPHLREQAEARICTYLISKGYSEERAMQLSTGPVVDVALSEIERLVKK